MPLDQSLSDRLNTLCNERTNAGRANLESALTECADAATALTRFEHYIDDAGDNNDDWKRLEDSSGYARLLLTILDQSDFLSTIITRRPEFMAWLHESVDLSETPSPQQLEDRLLDVSNEIDDRMTALRVFRQREILRIAARDVFAHAPLRAVTLDLANLAEAATDVAWRWAKEELEANHGAPKTDNGPAQFVVLGMGKLGGRELNFSSDIDLIFLYSENGETSGGSGRTLSNHEFFYRLGERIFKYLNEDTVEGRVFRVDMRLRPHGQMAPLAVTLDNALMYYEQTGQAWERQALIKVRPIAGDRELGESFVNETRPFVFPKFFDDETLESIRQIKAQMESKLERDGTTNTEVKLGRGGIRDVEFTIQMLQLLNGGRVPEVRAPHTLDAIRELGERNIITPFEADSLARNYTFMRQVEHRIQIEGSQQRHELPKEPTALERLARRLGYDSGDAFMVVYTDRADETRSILERYLAAKGRGTLWITDLLDSRSDAEEGLSRLAAKGFKNPEAARGEWLTLANGTAEAPHSQHVRQQFAAIAPKLIDALAECRDPDAELIRLTRILNQIHAPATVYSLLQQAEHLPAYLVKIVENSEFLAEILTRDPGLFDTLGNVAAIEGAPTKNELAELLASLSHAYNAEAALYRLRAGEMLRIGVRDLFDRASVSDIGRELTRLSEVCLASVIQKSRLATAERMGQATAGFAVLGLGKMGGAELGYGSDLDVIFVYDGSKPIESGAAASQYFGDIASRIVRRLKDQTEYGILYDVDARLRPYGKDSPLAVSLESLQEYYENTAEAWERFALMKARAVGGSRDFEAKAERIALDAAYSLPLTAENLDRVDEIRTKLRDSVPPGDLKRGEGGIGELEFGVRLLQLMTVADHPDVRTQRVDDALDALLEANAIDAATHDELNETYVFYRRIENRIRLQRGQSGSALPDSEEDRADLARRLDIEGDLTEQIAHHQERVHTFYTKVFEELRSKA